jgi:hypothetical protein
MSDSGGLGVAETRAARNARSAHVDTETLAARVTDLRLAIELAKPQIRMALLRPDLAQEHLVIALAHLEGRD